MKIPTTLEEFMIPFPKPEHVARFKEMYLENKGVELDDAEAYDQLMHLLVFVEYKKWNKIYQRAISDTLKAHGISAEEIRKELQFNK